MTNLCIDIGNSSVKAAVFDSKGMTFHTRLESHNLSELVPIAEQYNITRCIVSSTCGYTETDKVILQDICANTIYFDGSTPIPIKNLYSTPETLGPDRLAAAIGAYFEMQQDLVIIDAGTAITYDIVTSNGEYLGGNISPGTEMRLKALHDYTAKLPVVSEKGYLPQYGTDTETAIRCGVIHGISYEIQQFICEMILKFPNLVVFLTGGDNIDFEENIKKRIFVDRYLVLKGLNIVLNKLANGK